MSETMLAAVGLTGGYGRTDVLHDVGVRVEAGEIVALLGANGAGKSTLLNAMLGFLPRLRGTVTFCGENISSLEPEQIVRRGIGLVPERRQLFGTMTVQENLTLGAYCVGDRAEVKRQIEAQFERFPILRERRTQRAETMSGGQQQMLAIARALMASPKMLLLDEPSLGLAPLIVKQLLEEIQALRTAGGTILLVEQNATAALQIADRAYLMTTGRVEERMPKDLLADGSIAEAYLGGGLNAESMEQRIRAKVNAARPPGATGSAT